MKNKLLFLFAGLVVALFAAGAAYGAKSYSYFRVGNPSDITASTTAGTGVGFSTVYFLQAPGGPQVCQAGTPLTYLNIAVYRINATGTFNLSTWKGTGGVSYSVSANAGVLSSTQSGGAIY
jgi:hypothetical protein